MKTVFAVDIASWPGLQDAEAAGWEVVDFRPPKRGEKFLCGNGRVLTACINFSIAESRPILSRKVSMPHEIHKCINEAL